MDLVAYLRVSSEGQLDGYGLDVQRDAVHQWADTHGHRIVAVYIDGGLSGTLGPDERPGLQDALDALRPPPQAQGLIVARLDRLARALHVQESVLHTAWKVGATVFTVDGGEVREDDPDDPMRTFVRQVMGSAAQLERSLIAKRMRDGRRAKAAAGRKATGSYAYGYQGAGKGRERDAAPRDDEQAAVARIVALRAAGASYRVIARTLDDEGHKPRRAAAWSPMAVRGIALRVEAAAQD